MQHQGGPATPPTPPPALAYWLSAAARAVVRDAAVRAAGSDTSPALQDALTELDAAAVRSRWFDHPAAASFRRVAGHTPDAVTLRLTAAEHAALVACDPEVVGPLLDDDTSPARPAPTTGPDSPHAIELPVGPVGPVVVLDHDGITLGWAVAEYDGATVSVGRPSPSAGIWSKACDATRHEPVDVEVQDTARRLVAKAHPALSTLALARADFRPRRDESVLLQLPDIVVVVPTSLAARVVTYAAPALVLSIPADRLPAEPRPASTVS